MSSDTVTVTAAGAGRWRVELRGTETSTHEVSIPVDYLDKIGLGAFPVERILEESFRFLLEREPASSILRRFELPAIARYFPEYEKEIRRRLA
jgi:hypothetical protein